MRSFVVMMILGMMGPAQVVGGKVAGMHHAVGTFEVKMKPEPLSEVAGKTAIARMSMDKVFHGQLEATSQGEFLAAGSADGSGAYVALERVVGTLDGKAGSFAFVHSATMVEKVPEMSVKVVPGSGTDGLAGIAGTFTITVVDGKHQYRFDYSL